MNKQVHAYIMLLLVTVIWGATFPIIHNSVQNVSPIIFVVVRFGIAGLLLLPFVWQQFKVRDFASLKYGIILGLINSGSFILQSMALKTVDSARTGFLTAIYIILVPLMLPLFGFRKPTIGECIAAIICLFGVYIISGAHISDLQIGDLLVIASALCIGLGLIVVEFANKHIRSSKLFNFYQIIFTTMLPLGITVVHGEQMPTTLSFWLSVVYCAVFATVIAFLMQVKYQNVVGASKTALIFSLEAVFASVFAWFNGELITKQIILGGAIILFSTVYVDIVRIMRPGKESLD